jgi:hypothetical protein
VKATGAMIGAEMKFVGGKDGAGRVSEFVPWRA